MKKVMFFVFFITLMAGSVNTSVAADNKQITGEWKYEVPTAPYGYEKGVMVFSEKEGKLAGEVKLADGYKIELKNIEFAEGVFKFGLYIDYEYISVTSKIEGKKMTGAVKTPDGEMKLTAEKIK
jgi:hypothetical protein